MPNPLPIRTCVVCRTKARQADLLRIARDSAQQLRLLFGGSAYSRSAYVCDTDSCRRGVFERGRLARSLRNPVSDDEFEHLKTLLLCHKPLKTS